MILRPGLVGAALFGLAGCTAHPPTETTNPIAVPQDRTDVVSVCYDADDHARAEIEAVALTICPRDTAAVRPWKTDRYFNDCPMLKKSRITFLCVPAFGVR